MMTDSPDTIKLELSLREAYWLQTTLGMVMNLCRQWDNLSHNTQERDTGPIIATKLSLGIMDNWMHGNHSQ
jgi:hypothetical protein